MAQHENLFCFWLKKILMWLFKITTNSFKINLFIHILLCSLLSCINKYRNILQRIFDLKKKRFKTHFNTFCILPITAVMYISS